jgi:hypothetical protein
VSRGKNITRATMLRFVEDAARTYADKMLKKSDSYLGLTSKKDATTS